MQDYYERVRQAVTYLRTQTATMPKIGMLTGTGLGASVRSMTISASLAYSEIPHFPLPTVESHSGRLLLGKIGPRSTLVMQGRFHLYEGYSPLEVTFPIRVMQEMGIESLIVTNASGGLNPTYQPGDIMLIEDHINLTGTNPLIGPNNDEWGTRFPDMSRAYDEATLLQAESIGRNSNIRIQKGVYVGLKGPTLETPAEVRFLKTIGADAVGFSTVLEVITAVHAGMKILGLSIITNVHDPENPAPASVKDIIAVAQTAAPAIECIVRSVIEKAS